MDSMGALHRIEVILDRLSYREDGICGEMHDNIRALFRQGLASDKDVVELHELIEAWWPEITGLLGKLGGADLIREHNEWLQVCDPKIDIGQRALLAESLYDTVLHLISHVEVQAGKLGQQEARGSVVGGVAPAPTQPTVGNSEQHIPMHATKAFTQYRDAAKVLDEGEPKDREAYAYVARKSEQEGTHDELPSFDTWSRSVRLYRQYTKQQKHKPRAGRADTSGSIVNPSDR